MGLVPVGKQQNLFIAPSILMSTVGTLITAGLVGVFCSLVFGIGWIEGMLIGSVVASTDAASVFAILRSRKLNLKGGLAPILEIESGSNDPVAYMMTMIFMSLLSGVWRCFYSGDAGKTVNFWYWNRRFTW